ncbi:MAG: hypothetical protein ACNS63_06770 [Candidatus Nitrospinota bacterium M3_3B_026]
MGELRDKLFLQFINQALDKLRGEFREKHTAKKGDRFFIKGITYEIGPCQLENGAFAFEISSKIPKEALPPGKSAERYFNSVVRLVKKAGKKPDEAKMENIIHNTHEEELKERDYVKLKYRYRDGDLYTLKDMEKRLKTHQAKKIPLPDIPGVATPTGKIVLSLVTDSMFKLAKKNVQDLVTANEQIKADFKAKARTAKKPAAKKKKTTTGKRKVKG